VKPSELSEIITHLAFYAGWANAMSAVAVAKDIFHQRGIGIDQLPPAKEKLLPPLGASRATLVGNVLPLPESEVAEARELYLARYANSKYWVDFEDFSFYRMAVVDVYYVGGFGVMGWISAYEYGRSRPDPLADSMADIIQHMNADHKDALAALARGFARIESQEATMTAVDRLGFHVRLKTQDGIRGTRIAFPREVSNPAETRKVLVEMVQQARSRAE